MSSLLSSPLYKTQYVYIVDNGNNSDLVRNILRKRSWMIEAPQHFSNYHFKWKPTSYNLKYDELGKKPINKKCYNHLEFHHEITDKSKLFQNLKIYCKVKIFLLDILNFRMEKLILMKFCLRPSFLILMETVLKANYSCFQIYIMRLMN